MCALNILSHTSPPPEYSFCRHFTDLGRLEFVKKSNPTFTRLKEIQKSDSARRPRKEKLRRVKKANLAELPHQSAVKNRTRTLTRECMYWVVICLRISFLLQVNLSIKPAHRYSSWATEKKKQGTENIITACPTKLLLRFQFKREATGGMGRAFFSYTTGSSMRPFNILHFKSEG